VIKEGTKMAQITNKIVPSSDSQKFWVQFPAGAKDYSLLHSVQTGTGAHPQWVSEVIFWGVERPEREADRSLPSNSDVKNGETVPSPPYTSLLRDN
jgi:hypothetical protein